MATAKWTEAALRGKRVAVVGLGKSGLAVLRFLSARGALPMAAGASTEGRP